LNRNNVNQHFSPLGPRGCANPVHGAPPQRIRTRTIEHHARLLRRVDFIASPATPCTAPAIPAEALRGESNLPLAGRLMQFILAGNFAGLPAMSVPVGHDAAGATRVSRIG
jgi:Asp-tRNA(Asn)/Glu-tRNA(Gln) amidotransferase A subunit family amidase